MAEHWHREVEGAPSLETFKVTLDRTLSNLVQLKMSLLMTGVGHLGVPSTPNHSLIQWKIFVCNTTITTCGQLMIFRIIHAQMSTNTSKSHVHFYHLEWRFPISQSPNPAQLFLFYSALLNTIGHDLQKSLTVHHSVSKHNLVPVLQGLGQRCWQCHLPPHSFLTPTPCAHFISWEFILS